eukprot:SAG11_NODE_2122_length_3784_cov_3.569878_1_plen_67_part_00
MVARQSHMTHSADGLHTRGLRYPYSFELCVRTGLHDLVDWDYWDLQFMNASHFWDKICQSDPNKYM